MGFTIRWKRMGIAYQITVLQAMVRADSPRLAFAGFLPALPTLSQRELHIDSHSGRRREIKPDSMSNAAFVSENAEGAFYLAHAGVVE
jgi:hypothetical protein